jgi:hypothetical protein
MYLYVQLALSSSHHVRNNLVHTKGENGDTKELQDRLGAPGLTRWVLIAPLPLLVVATLHLYLETLFTYILLYDHAATTYKK